MTEIDAVSADAWCTTEDVRGRLKIEVGNQEPDFEVDIRNATDSIQSRWAEATGNPPEDAPASDADVHDLLQQATAYLAASEAHLKFAANVSSRNDGDQRHVFLEGKADDKFGEWRAVADLEAESDPDDSGVGGVAGRISSKTDDIIG